MIVSEGLTYQYPAGPRISLPDINCPEGSQWLILGRSGSGKTTFLHLLAGLRTPTSGKIVVNGVDLTDLNTSSLDKFRGENIGIIFQQPHFVRSLSVRENMSLAMRLAGKKVDKDRIRHLLDRLNISKYMDKPAHRLSQGEQQRANIGRALVNSPKVIFADEPTSALDDYNCERVIELLAEQARAEDACLLIVTHDGRLKEKFKNQIVLSETNQNL